MRCSTCGETLQPGAVRCPTCGTSTPIGMAITRPTGVRRCPRCQYQGEGMSYFRRTGHLGLLIASSFFTMGFGGLVYWAARRKHLICPRCGLAWENASRALAVAGDETEKRVVEAEPDEKLPSAGLKRRILGTAMVLVASLLVLIGFVDWAMEAVAVGSVLGGGGSMMFYWGWQGLQDRRRAIMRGLQRKILRLASARGGRLTVTEVAADLNLALPAAERIMEEMDDGFRVRSDISNDGVLYYEFPEIRHRAELGVSEGIAELGPGD